MRKTDKVKSINKSRSNQITETEHIVDKSGSIPRNILSNKSYIIENPSEIYISRKFLCDSVLYVQGECLSSVTPYNVCISSYIKRKKTSDTYIIIKQPIKEPVNPRKITQENPFTEVEKGITKETPQSFLNKVDYKGDTNEKTHGYDDSPSETDGCVRRIQIRYF